GRREGGCVDVDMQVAVGVDTEVAVDVDMKVDVAVNVDVEVEKQKVLWYKSFDASNGSGVGCGAMAFEALRSIWFGGPVWLSWPAFGFRSDLAGVRSDWVEARSDPVRGTFVYSFPNWSRDFEVYLVRKPAG
ncbi:MAG: hypothetical protein Q9216_007199, partial [Gyalolechia sp. 2 TL-2023]